MDCTASGRCQELGDWTITLSLPQRGPTYPHAASLVSFKSTESRLPMLARRHRKMVTLRKVWTVTVIITIIRAENFNKPILRKMSGRYVVVVKKMKNIGGVRGFYALLEADILG